MAMRRRALLWLGGLALIALALLLTDGLLWEPGLTEDNVRRIRPGMPLAEVEALLGGLLSAILATCTEIEPPHYCERNGSVRIDATDRVTPLPSRAGSTRIAHGHRPQPPLRRARLAG
jgi:hypothetical protein